MNKAVVFSILLLFLSLVISAQNLVPNGGFETFSSLPDDDCDWQLAQGWGNAALSNFCNSNNGTPDYFHLQGTGVFSSLPTNYFSTINPFEGEAIMGLAGFSTFSSNFREYISIPLSTSLQPGILYEVSFSISQGTPEVDGFAIDGWGLALSENPLLQAANTNGLIAAPANSSFLVPSIISSPDWQTFSFAFVANAEYTHVTFGNFLPDNQLSSQNNGNPGSFAFSYAFVDQISVIRMNLLLPVELLYFKAEKRMEKQVELKWATASEMNNSYFRIERSSDLEAWKTLGYIEGAGNSNSMEFYNYIDKAPLNGTAYYRLKQVDFDGTFAYSNVEAIVCDTMLPTNLMVYPNPASHQIRIRLGAEEFTNFDIIDVQGRSCISDVVLLNTTSDTSELDIRLLAPGMYLVKANQKITRFIKN